MAIFVCTKDDISDLVRLDKKCFDRGEAFPRKLIENHFNSGTKIYRIEVGSFKFAAVFYMDRQVTETHVASIGVDPKFRGKGLGHVIMKRILRWKRPIVLEVRITNIPAIGLYEKYGFVKYGYLKNHYPDGSDAHKMILL